MAGLVEARDMLGGAVGRLASLLRSGIDPEAPANGGWNVGEVAAHLSHGFGMVPLLATGASPALGPDLVQVGAFTATLVAAESERDLDALAGRIEAGYRALVDGTAGLDEAERRTWVLEGSTLPVTSFFGHLLNEALVHGHDIATATGRPWDIPRREATVALLDFVVPVIQAIDPGALVVEATAGHLRATYDIRLRGGGQVHFVFHDGALQALEPTPGRRVDCHISADPATFLLVLWARQSQWGPIARGKMTAWGRKPWLGLRLRAYLRNP